MRKINGQCTSQAVVNLTKQLFGEHGVPTKVISDNGRHYDSESYRKFAQEWEFQHITSSPHYPQSNGFIERTIQTIKNTLKKCSESNADKDLALLCLRTTPISSTIPTPAELLYSRKLSSNLPAKINNKHGDKDQIYEQLEKRQERQKEYHDKTASDLPPLYKGQPVYIQDQQSKQWNKGTIQEKREEPRSYNVTMPNGKTLRRNRKQLRERTERREHNEDNNADHTVVSDLPVNSGSESDRTRSIEEDKTVLEPQNTVSGQWTVTKSGRTVRKPERFCDEICVYDSDFE